MKYLIATVLAAALTGCAAFNPEGFEIGGKIGMYATQDRQVSETISTKPRPFICNIRSCDAQGNVIQQGS